MPNQNANGLAEPDTSTDIAVIGLACRFPGARDATEFWANLEAGRESLRDVSAQEYLAAGGDPAGLNDPSLVRVESDFPDMDCFDAGFFGYSPAEAEVLDPQQRLFLECGYHALENAGYHASGHPAAIGVYAGANESRYYIHHLSPWLAGAPDSVASIAVETANAPGMLATRLSYHLDLRGPSVSVQTTCSTSLVAVHLACQDLLHYSADMALAGLRLIRRCAGVTATSPTAHCPPTDAAGRFPLTRRACPRATASGWSSSSAWLTLSLIEITSGR